MLHQVSRPSHGLRQRRRECSLLGLGGSSSLLSSLLSSLSGGLSLLHVLRDELLVLLGSFSGGLGLLQLVSLHHTLSADVLLGDESLDPWSLPEGLVTSLDFSVDDISTHIIGLLVKVEVSSNVGSSLLSEAVWLWVVGEASDVLLSLLDD